MKKKYLVSIFLVLFFLILISIFFVEIPSPSKLITENYELEIL